MNRTLAYAIVFLLIGLVVGYSASMIPSADEGSEGLEIPHTSSSIGSVDPDNSDRQLFSYEFDLYNYEDGSIYLSSVEPVFSDEFSKRILTSDTAISVDRNIDSGSSITLGGQVEFNATGLSKDEIIGMEPFILGMRLSSTEILPFP